MTALFDLRGKTALVTGGARGLGRMIARGLLEAGAKVYISSRKPEICEQTAQEFSGLGACVALSGDLATPSAATALAQAIAAQESRLHILVNNAGRSWGAPLESFPDDAWPNIMTVNVQGPFTLVRELLPLLRVAGTGDDPARVINIGSLAGARVEPISAYSYAASKAALHHLSRLLAAELAPSHITVNTVVPGYFPTHITAHLRAREEQYRELLGRIPLGRLGEPDDIAGTCVFLASRAGRYISGAELMVDGGMAGCR